MGSLPVQAWTQAGPLFLPKLHRDFLPVPDRTEAHSPHPYHPFPAFPAPPQARPYLLRKDVPAGPRQQMKRLWQLCHLPSLAAVPH